MLLNKLSFLVLHNRVSVFAVLLRERSGVKLHCCASCLQALEMNSEPGGESMENTRLLHTIMKLTLYFLRNETHSPLG